MLFWWFYRGRPSERRALWALDVHGDAEVDEQNTVIESEDDRVTAAEIRAIAQNTATRFRPDAAQDL